MKIKIDLPIGFRGRVVNGQGLPVFTSPMVENHLDLTFYPAPYAVTPFQGLLRVAEEEETLPLLPDQIGYRLEIFPRDQTDLGQTYPITISVFAQSAAISLPIVRR